MERLTKRLSSGAADYNYPASCYFDDSGPDRIAQSAFRQRCVEQLAEYEDTELTPEEVDMDHEAAEQLRHLYRNCDLDRLEKLVKADKAGRLVVLPCQSGEHVFALLDGQKRVRECEVKYAVLDSWLKVLYLAPIDDPGNLYSAPFGAFGQSVFLTREEAEKVLKAEKVLEAMKNE
mgnify:FL=1